MTKYVYSAIFLVMLSAGICAQQADPCGELAGPALGQCRSKQQNIQLQQLEQLQLQFQQQQEPQKQLDEQQRHIQDQLDNLRLQSEVLRQQLEHERTANQSAPALVPAPAMDFSKTAEAKSWRSDNPWYGSDYAKTEYAMRYSKQLREERPDLTGRAFYDAISAKVNETFGAKK
jgi:hypothetical protein